MILEIHCITLLLRNLFSALTLLSSVPNREGESVGIRDRKKAIGNHTNILHFKYTSIGVLPFNYNSILFIIYFNSKLGYCKESRCHIKLFGYVTIFFSSHIKN
jgi:hypothetical protein